MVVDQVSPKFPQIYSFFLLILKEIVSDSVSLPGFVMRYLFRLLIDYLMVILIFV